MIWRIFYVFSFINIFFSTPLFCILNQNFIQHTELPLELQESIDNKEVNIQQTDVVFKPCGNGKAPYLPGTTRMQFGYNFVRDQLSMHGSHLEILDTYSTHRNNLTVILNGVCYKIPDAFIAPNALGVSFRSYASTLLKSTGASSSGESRYLKSKNHEIDLSLGIKGLEFSIDTAFTHSKETKMEQKFSYGTTLDTSQTKYFNYMYGLQVKQPIPSQRIVHVWKKLYEETLKLKNEQDIYILYRSYFNTHGTHYLSAGMVGGEWKVGFTVDRYHKTTNSSTTMGRANCLGAKASGLYMGVSGKVALRACWKQFKSEYKDASFLSLTKHSWSICKGGASKCPYGPGYDEKPKDAFELWKETVKTDPELVNGTKRWITQLLDFLIQFADYSSFPEYKDRVNQFGNPSKRLSENISKLKQFRTIMHKYLINYVKEYKFCNQFGTDPFCGKCFRKCWEGRAISYKPTSNECVCEPKVTPTDPPITDKDCYWHYGRARCEPANKCAYRYKFGDWSLGSSCRVA